MHLHSGDAGERQTPHRVPAWGPFAKGQTQRNLGASAHQPIEFTGHMVGRQRAAMGVEQEDQLHQDRRRVGLLGAKVEHRHDVALIVTGSRTREDRGPWCVRIMLQRKSVPSISRAAILRFGSPFLKAQGYSSTWICSWNQYTSFLSGSTVLEHQPPALASLQPHHEDFGK